MSERADDGEEAVDRLVEEEMAKAVEAARAAGDGQDQSRSRPRSYAVSTVTAKDTVGTVILGILSVILLLALLAAHRRERRRTAETRA